MTADRTTHHFFTDPGLLTDRRALLRDDAARHARVVRLRGGERISVADGTGRLADATVESVTQREVSARVLGVAVHERPRPLLVLHLAVLKGDAMESAVRRAVEVGADRIVVFPSARSVPRHSPERRGRLAHRLRAVAASAAAQCGSTFLTDVDVAASAPPLGDGGIVLHPAGDGRVADAVRASSHVEVVVAVGPEGGFEDAEVDAYARAGARVVSLGGRVMRAETAAGAGLAVVAHAVGRLG